MNNCNRKLKENVKIYTDFVLAVLLWIFAHKMNKSEGSIGKQYWSVRIWYGSKCHWFSLWALGRLLRALLDLLWQPVENFCGAGAVALRINWAKGLDTWWQLKKKYHWFCIWCTLLQLFDNIEWFSHPCSHAFNLWIVICFLCKLFLVSVWFSFIHRQKEWMLYGEKLLVLKVSSYCYALSFSFCR